MTATDHLSGKQFFHGSSAAIPVGGTLVPGAQIGKRNYPSLRTVGNRVSNSKVFTTTDENTAWDFADSGAKSNNPGIRQRVYVARPSEDARPGLNHNEHPRWNGYTGGRENLKEYVSSTAEVADRIDIKPGHQGTFPLNWHQFTPKNRWHTDVNHPTDEAVHYGHPGSALYNQSLKDTYGEIQPKPEPPQKEKLF